MQDTALGGRYELHDLIGAGGSGRVYRGYDRRLRRPVAIKVLDERVSADAASIARFRREARIAAGLSHPHIVTIYDWGEMPPASPGNRPNHYLVMEYVPGETLKERIARDGPLPEGEALDIAAQIAGALEEAHRAGIIHRDVNPRNILLTADGRAKIADFGIAHGPDMTELTITDKVFGTAQYLSPEQARGLPLDPRTDLYSLGITLYEMLAGRPPFIGSNPVEVALQHVNGQPPDLRRLRPGLSPATDAAVKRLLAKNPSHRFPSAAAAEAALRSIEVRRADTRTAAAPLARSSRRIPRRLIAAPLLILLVLLGGAVIAYSQLHPSHTSLGTSRRPHHAAAHATPHPTARPTARPTAQPTARPTGVPTSPPSTGASVSTKPTVGSGHPSAGAPPPAPAPTQIPPAPPASAPGQEPSGHPEHPAHPAHPAHPGPGPGPAPAASDEAAPAQAVATFYRLVATHQFSAAAALWSSSMQQNYPPAANIDQRFGSVSSITVKARTVAFDPAAGTAVVSVDVVEVDGPGTTHEFVGTWNLIRTSGTWLLNYPNLHSA